MVPYCPRCGTALSSHEVAQGYKDVKETSIFVRFPRQSRRRRELPGLDHHALDAAFQRGAVRERGGQKYALVEYEGTKSSIMAAALVSGLLGEEAKDHLRHYPGSALEHKEYDTAVCV